MHIYHDPNHYVHTINIYCFTKDAELAYAHAKFDTSPKTKKVNK